MRPRVRLDMSGVREDKETAGDALGSFEQRHLEWGIEEEGTVRSQLVSTSGDSDLPGHRARVFALADVWQSWLVADPTLGVLQPSSTSSLAVDVEPVQNSAGSAARLIVTVSYLARIYPEEP